MMIEKMRSVVISEENYMKCVEFYAKHTTANNDDFLLPTTHNHRDKQML